MNRFSLIAVCTLLLAAAACRENAQPKGPNPPPETPASVQLTVAVFNDAPLASGIRLQQGEWNAHSGGRLRVIEADRARWHDSEIPAADLFVFPPRYLGELVEKDLLRPLRSSVLESKSVDLSDLFPLVRQYEMTYGNKAYALPLCTQTPLLCLAGDQQQTGAVQQLTASWSDYVDAAEALRDGPTQAVIEPTAEPWLAVMLILRAAANSEMDDRAELLFDSETMAPRLLTPPVVRGLSEMKRLHEGAALADNLSPGDACASVLRAAATAAVGLPPASVDLGGLPSAASDEPRRRTTRWREPPPARQSYSATLQEWRDARGETPALLGVGGAMLGVTTSTKNTAAAFRLAAWLAEPQRAGQFASRSAAAMPCRVSHAASSRAWFGGGLTDSEKGQAAAAVQSLLSREAYVQVPRIPGIDAYLAALHRASARAISGQVSVEDALREASVAWEAITERLSRERQIAAYQRQQQ